MPQVRWPSEAVELGLAMARRPWKAIVRKETPFPDGFLGAATLPRAPYGSPLIKHGGINIRCNNIEPDR